MSEGLRVTYPKERVMLYQPRSMKEKGLVNAGTRLLLGDITPDSLRSHQTLLENPLTCSIVEILPKKNGVVFEPEPLERLKKRIISPGGTFINIETHDEVTPSAVGAELRDNLADLVERPTLTVVSSGLANAVYRLKQVMIDSKIASESDLDDVDINRCFISPYSRAKNPFEELAQNYLRFIISRYALQHLLYLDIHGESDDFDVLPHVILGRTAEPFLRNRLYEQTKNNFPFLTVLWDINEPAYSAQLYNQSFADSLLAFGLADSVTIECAAAKGGVHERNKHLTKLAVIKAMSVNRLLDEQSVDKLSEQYRSLISGRIPGSANNAFENRALRREIVEIEIESSGVMQMILNLSDAPRLKGGQLFALINSSSFDRSKPLIDSFVRIPKDIKECVILGFPDSGILQAGQRILVTLAVPED